MTSAQQSYRTELTVATQAALKAGELLLNQYGRLKKRQIKVKGPNDFVTELDHRSEDLIRSCLLKRFPHDAMKGEEGGDRGKGGRVWIVDPLDGTMNYIHEFPLFCVSIGLQIGNKMAVGVVYDPIHQELFTSCRGHGATLNKKRLHVSKVKHLKSAFLGTGFPFKAHAYIDPYLKSFRELFDHSKGIRRGGSAALDICYVAAGRFDGFWELNLYPWDIAAAILMVEEAGGKITDFYGTQTQFQKGHLVATNRSIHSEIVRTVKRVFKGWHIERV